MGEGPCGNSEAAADMNEEEESSKRSTSHEATIHSGLEPNATRVGWIRTSAAFTSGGLPHPRESYVALPWPSSKTRLVKT